MPERCTFERYTRHPEAQKGCRTPADSEKFCYYAAVSICLGKRSLGLRARGAGILLLVLASLASAPAAAQAVADFYRGKTITISVGLSAGGGYDLHARVLARYLGKHLPGAPAVVVKNAPGAGGLTLVNALYSTLPRDGTELATFERGILLEPLLDQAQARFDPLRFSWIGSTDNDASTCLSWHTSAVKTMDDLMRTELIVGGTGSTAIANTFPRVLNAVLGTKFRVIPGYPGANDALLAMERGETQGFCSLGFSTLEAIRPGWMRDHKVNVFVQLALQKSNEHPDVPLALDFAKTEADRRALELVFSPNLFARPFAAPRGVPAERIAALRQAFDDTMADPDFLAEAKARDLHIERVTAVGLEQALRRVYATPPEIVARVKEAVN
jgi:tripartite-type tricarboxylate transporter receptor subunit TctC